MSRIGKKPVSIPSGVKVATQSLPAGSGGGTRVQVDGQKGKLSLDLRAEVSVKVEGDTVTVSRNGEEPFARAYYGTARALIANMVEGCTKGFQKDLEIIGVGYQAKVQGKKLVMNMGFCHPVELAIPQGLTVEAPKPTSVSVSGSDKQAVGEFAAQIRKVRPPEPYKGKGIRYVGEHVTRKAGKAFGSGE